MPKPPKTGSAAADPLAARFAAAWAARPPGRALLAVSGGGDSLALMHLAAGAGGDLHVLTVDHGLRPAAAAEAALVARQAAALGVPHRTVRWDGRAARGNLQAAARAARHLLFAEEAARVGAGFVATGHTLDDQAETVLMRLARGSGVDGLAAMRVLSERDGLAVFRPLLAIRRDELRAWLTARGVDWADDPTNEDPAFDRARARLALARLEPLGLTAERLARTAEHMARAADALERAAAALLPPPGHAGERVLSRAALRATLPETRLRALARVLQDVSGAPYRPRFDSLTALEAAVAGPGDGGWTLHGCVVRAAPDALSVYREPAAAHARTPFRPGVVWDRRWRIEGPDARGLEVRALGTAAAPGDDPRWQAAPPLARQTTPTLWRGDALVAVPLAGGAAAAGYKASLLRR